MNTAQDRYFQKKLMEANSNQLSEVDVHQLYQDMANTGYAFLHQEISIHCRLLMMKGYIQIPKNYTLVPVTPEEVIKLQKSRKQKNNPILN